MNTHAVEKLRRQLLRRKLDALLVTDKANSAYLSGFNGEGQLLVTLTKNILLTDFRFRQEAKEELKQLQIPQQALPEVIIKSKIKHLGFEAMSLSYQEHQCLKTRLKSVKITPTINIIQQIRSVKTVKEIRLIKQAARLAVESMDYAQRIISPKKTELEIVKRLERFILKQTNQAPAFKPIVACGPRSSLPHAKVSNRIIARNQPVLVDLGCVVSGYNSDLTRTMFLGKISRKFRRIYDTVIQAQQAAIKGIQAGIEISKIDKIARQCIAKAGFGCFFGHALGHGIGQEVHEYPSISFRNQDRLQANMVITIEPGIYIPGLGGVRVEDMVLVTTKGCEVLTG